MTSLVCYSRFRVSVPGRVNVIHEEETRAEKTREPSLSAAQILQVSPPLLTESVGRREGRKLPLSHLLLGPVCPHKALGGIGCAVN